MSKFRISEAAKIKGVSPSTLRRWESEGKLIPERTASGHRRYSMSQLLGVESHRAYTIGYVRVSSHDQKQELERQKSIIELFCAQNGWDHEIIQDLGSGMNYSKSGLKRLLRLITSGEIDRLVLTHKDRLLRFGAELVFSICEQFGVEIVIINRTEDASFEEDLANDVLEIITVFSARLYGSRNHKNKKIVEELKKVSEEL
ncbi:IS607 family transposase [Phormidium pseudopriestleyi FRX01]|uniref:IS607 family transposase n=1 Tax=Phormidium pseudopriestleyi FRX01 TaxID=1759528 RepID=A0ABS3FUB2_9CYAN|nr:IS607 family transposase [Phormidium pseudopriestleyi]MBO0350700.1 IS607 family transposase [Phormidium pseudopriestleyi FRX01]